MVIRTEADSVLRGFVYFLVALTAVVATVVTIGLCGEAVASEAKSDVLCVGDSLTDGGYPEVLKVKLGEAASVVVNAHKNIRAMSVLKRMDDSIKESRPDVVIWYAGINDCVGETGSLGLDLDVFAAMEMAVSRVSKIGGKLFLVKHYPWASYPGQLGGAQACSFRVNAFIDKLSCENDFVFPIDTSSMGKNGDLISRYSSGDGLHLNYRGNKVLAGLVLEAMKSAD